MLSIHVRFVLTFKLPHIIMVALYNFQSCEVEITLFKLVQIGLTDALENCWIEHATFGVVASA